MTSFPRQLEVDQQARTQILQACHSFLVPVARFLLRSGISYREFSDVCRTAFVLVARDDYGIRGRPTNTSRIAAMTGIPRKEIARLRQLLEAYDMDARARLSPLSDVLHVWHTSKTYLTDEGSPIPLPFEGGDVSFSSLVRECAGDVPPGAIRTELSRYGAISTDEFGMLHSLRREVVPDTFDMKLVSAISFSLTALAQTIAHNADPSRMGSGRIERYVQSDSMSPAAKEVLEPILRERVEGFSREIDDLFAQFSEGSEKEMTNRARVGVGMYYFEDDATR